MKRLSHDVDRSLLGVAEIGTNACLEMLEMFQKFSRFYIALFL
jgi:hypothetical protein